LWHATTRLSPHCPVCPAGVKYINGYDDPEIVAGAGTIGE
jgi:hypothetical protein